MAKFNPHARLEIGAHLTFGFFRDGSSNFSSLVVGSKYQAGGPIALQPLTLCCPLATSTIPAWPSVFMQTVEFGTAFRLNSSIYKSPG